MLTALAVIQITTCAPDITSSSLAKLYEGLSPAWKSLFHIVGFVKVEPPIYIHLMPYVVLQSFSVVMLKAIRMKLAKE